MRISIAFQCTNCGWWNYPTLRDNMSGNFTIRCGHCDHGHHRAVIDGRVTEDRHNYLAGGLEVIHVMKSACQEKPRRPSKLAQLRDRFFAGA
jgi:hypothetical protein